MNSEETADRLLSIAEDRLRNRPGAHNKFRLTLKTTAQGQALMVRAQAMPIAWEQAEQLGSEKASQLIAEHLTSVVDSWAQSQPRPNAVVPLPLETAAPDLRAAKSNWDSEAQALRHCLQILAPRASPYERQTMSMNIEQRINGQSNAILSIAFDDLGTLFYPDDSMRAEELGRKMRAAAIAGEFPTIIPDKQHAFVSDLAAWPDCPPIPMASPLRYWLPFMPTEACRESVPAPDGTSAGVLAKRVEAAPLRNQLKNRSYVLAAVIEQAEHSCGFPGRV